MSHSITITLSQAAQAAALRAGEPAQREQTYEVPPELVGRLIDLGADVGADGEVHFHLGPPSDYVGSERVLTPHALDARPVDACAAIEAVEAVVAAHKAAIAAERERQAALREARVQEALARPDEDWIEGTYQVVRSPCHYSDPRLDARRVAVAAGAVFRACVDSAERKEAEAKAKRLAAVEAERLAAVEAERWIAAHGSERLRRLVEEEIEHQAAYRSERLAVERPGWRWAANVSGDHSEPRNATTSALELLDAARAAGEPEAELRYWVDEPESEYDDDQRIWRGYVAVATYLGREIVWGGPE